MNAFHQVEGAVVEKNGKECKVGFVVTHVDNKTKRWFGKDHLDGSIKFEGNFMTYGTHRKESLDQEDTNPKEPGEEEPSDFESALPSFSQHNRSATMPISTTLGNPNLQHASNSRIANRLAPNLEEESHIPLPAAMTNTSYQPPAGLIFPSSSSQSYSARPGRLAPEASGNSMQSVGSGRSLGRLEQGEFEDRLESSKRSFATGQLPISASRLDRSYSLPQNAGNHGPQQSTRTNARNLLPGPRTACKAIYQTQAFAVQQAQSLILDLVSPSLHRPEVFQSAGTTTETGDSWTRHYPLGRERVGVWIQETRRVTSTAKAGHEWFGDA
jgi:hypothetical protein